MREKSILLDVEDRIATITLNRPDRKNAIKSGKVPPNNPNSSPIIEKIKSVCGVGRRWFFSILFPRPTPNKPPSCIALRAKLSWDFGSISGFRKVFILLAKWSEFEYEIKPTNRVTIIIKNKIRNEAPAKK